jgi:hypothetical protein
MNFTFAFNPIAIASGVGAVIAIFFAYFPRVRTWFASLEQETRSLITLGVLLLAEIVISLLSFYQVIVTVPPFSWEEAVAIAVALVVSNSPVQQLLPVAKDVKLVLQEKMLKLLRASKYK